MDIHIKGFQELTVNLLEHEFGEVSMYIFYFSK